MKLLLLRILVGSILLTAASTQAQTRVTTTHANDPGKAHGTPVGPPTKPADVSFSGELFSIQKEREPREITVCNMDGRGNWKYQVNARMVVGDTTYWLTTETRVLNSGVVGDLRSVTVGDHVAGSYKEFRSLPDRKPIFIGMTSSFTPKAGAGAAKVAAPVNKEIEAKKRAEADARTLQYHQDLANQGEARGQYEMGLHYLKGTCGVPVDADRAKDYFTKAAAQGYKDAALELSRLASAAK